MAFVRFLALDLSLSTGWAVYGPGMDRPEYGLAVWDAKRVGTRNREAREWVRQRIIHAEAEVVVKEALPPMQGATNFAAMGTLAYLHGMVEEVCATLHVPCEDIAIMTWRKHFLGTGTAPKGMTAPQRKTWWKRKAIARCEELGWPVKGNDLAEALGIAYAWRLAHDRSFASLDGPLMARARVMA